MGDILQSMGGSHERTGGGCDEKVAQGHREVIAVVETLSETDRRTRSAIEGVPVR